MKHPLRRTATLFALSLGCALGAQAQTASTLDTVMQTGVLRACTPGDYKPFSFLRSDGVFEGIDADLAQSLAKALGVQLKLIWAPAGRAAASCSAFSIGLSDSVRCSKP